MNILFGLMLLELVIEGSVRLFAVGPLSARILMFGIALAVWMGMAFRQPQRTAAERMALQWVLLFFAAHIPSAISAAMNGIGIGKILGEVQPLLFCLAAPFMAMCLSSLDNVERAARLGVAIVSLLLMLGYMSAPCPRARSTPPH